MGIVRTDESRRTEIEEFCRMLLSCRGLREGKDGDQFNYGRRGAAAGRDGDGDDAILERKPVCVTSGVSFLGIAVVNQLLLRGYAVRIIVDNQEDIERMRELEISGDMNGTENLIGVVMANLNDRHSLVEAFSGCCGVFHTASFVDPSGLSGYTKTMAEIEVKAMENVAEACATTPSVRNCVLTSSLLTCIWRDNSLDNLPLIVDHDCWSDESLCQDKKLWYALGKLRAEKTAWRIAEERGLKLATICPGLVTGPAIYRRSPTATIAYLKGAQEMYTNGLLATVDVNRLAEAHVLVFEEMYKSACGRYICFDHVVQSEEDIQKLAQATGMGMSINMIVLQNDSSRSSDRFTLSNRKLSSLMSRTQRCAHQT